MLVAPEDGSPSRTDVDFEIEIKRDAQFQSPIQISASGILNPPNSDHIRTQDFRAFVIPGSATRGSGPLLIVFCTRVQQAGGPPAVRLDVTFRPNSASDLSISVIDASAAKTSMGIEGVSPIFGTPGSNDPMVERTPSAGNFLFAEKSDQLTAYLSQR